MTEVESYCMICGETYMDHYDAIAHIYNNHDFCGCPPETQVNHREVDPTEEFIGDFRVIMEEKDAPVSVDYFVSHTDVQNRREAKNVLLEMMCRGMITTCPGFEYKLASHVE